MIWMGVSCFEKGIVDIKGSEIPPGDMKPISIASAAGNPLTHSSLTEGQLATVSQLIIPLFKLLQICPGAVFPIWVAQQSGGMIGHKGGDILKEVFPLSQLAHAFAGLQ